jgi:hypothetical protein
MTLFNRFLAAKVNQEGVNFRDFFILGPAPTRGKTEMAFAL